MVEFVNSRMRWRLPDRVASWATLFVATLLAASSQTLAQSASQPLSDPTRPANAVLEADATGSDAASVPVLQSVLISPRRKVAVISGQTLHVGEKFGAAMLVKINAQEVVLKNGTELQTLKLYPDIQKQMAGKPAKKAAKPAVNSVKDQ
ncbi:MAG: putative exported protein [Pseudomonadota bacterium]|jgi:MSHA biogenesis protein MshK